MSVVGLASLLRMTQSGQSISLFVNEMLSKTDEADMLMSLAAVSVLTGDHENALTMQAQALRLKQAFLQEAPSGTTRLKLLAVMTPGEYMSANTPLEFLLEDSDVELHMLFLADNLPPTAEFPDHDIAFVAAAQSDHNIPLLQSIATISWPKPLLNRPEKILRLSRDNVYSLLESAPGIAIAQTVRMERSAPEKERPFDFPFIIRPVDSHAGKGLARVESPGQIGAYLKSHPQKEFQLSRYIDYREKDGFYRKYRIVMIEGKPYAYHMAISENWMVHYVSAEMDQSAEKRAEEASFLRNFEKDFALRHQKAFRAMAERIDLDYYVVDCAESPDGKLLIFELDNCGFVHKMDTAGLFAYKKEPLDRLTEAFLQMLKNRI